MKTEATKKAIRPIQSTELCDDAYTQVVKPVNGWSVRLAFEHV